MTEQILTALLTTLGVVVGSLVTYFSTREQKLMKKAEKQIINLCAQVEAFHRLEQLYSAEIAALDPSRGKQKTILEDMRSLVASEDYERSSMTSNEARKIRGQWA
jgi:hypothetical protein